MADRLSNWCDCFIQRDFEGFIGLARLRHPLTYDHAYAGPDLADHGADFTTSDVTSGCKAKYTRWGEIETAGLLYR